MIIAWNSSYPLSIGISLDDFVFNHISILFWVALPLTLASMYIIVANLKSEFLKWVVTVSLVITMYSLSYFYYMLPGSDSHYFRGLTESFIEKNDLSNLTPGHLYFEWPNFFRLGKMATSVSGLSFVYYEFILYTIMGFLLATALYLYSFKTHKKMGFVAVISFFIINYYFLNYQYAPFSLAFSLLLVLLAFEKHETDSYERTLTKALLFTGITLTHAFVPLFYILYQLLLYILNRTKKNLGFFLLTTTIFFAWQIFQAPLNFVKNIKVFMAASPEYAAKIEGTLTSASIPLDIVAQTFSRFVVVATAIVCGIGFITLLIRKKVGLTDKAVFLSGIVYSILGALVFLLGSRTYSIVTIPISLGASYLFESRFRQYLKCLFFVLLILFLSIPLHSSFYDRDVLFQTKEAYEAANFMLDHYNGTNRNYILANYRVMTYLRYKITGADISHHPLEFKEADIIVYTVGLGRSLLKENYTIEKILSGERLNLVYDNGLSSIATRSWNFTWAPKR
jgi:hypothetical protein